jgi:thiamine biosynthesis lipoprotein
MSTFDLEFTCMGSAFRLLVGEPVEPGLPQPETSARLAREALDRFDARLSRFKPDSELCALNADPRTAVPASPLMRGAVRAALWAAEKTGGLVDPTLLGELEAAGYRTSLSGTESAPLAEALATAPIRRPARPHPAQRWREVRVEGDAIVRPPGVRLDSGGCGKGLAADAAARLLESEGASRFAVDCGGDLRLGVGDAGGEPWPVLVEHPLTGEVVHELRVRNGGVASSGLGTRIWRTPGGSFAHHLLDPATGEPAWTGLIGATAMAPTTLEAETLSKAATLGGPHLGRRLLRDHGGVLFHDDGDVEVLGPARARPRVRVTMTERGVAVGAAA